MPTYPGQHTVFLFEVLMPSVFGFDPVCLLRWGRLLQGRACQWNVERQVRNHRCPAALLCFENCSTDGGLLPFQGAGHGFQLLCQVHLLAVGIGVQGFENLWKELMLDTFESSILKNISKIVVSLQLL